MKQKADGHFFTKTAVRPFPYVPTKALEEEEADEYGSYGYAASPSLGEAASSIPKLLMPPLPTETHSTGAASSIHVGSGRSAFVRLQLNRGEGGFGQLKHLKRGYS